MDNEAAFKLMASEVRAMNARQDAHEAQTGKTFADLIVESREWLKAEAEKRAAADAAEAEKRAAADAAEAERRAAADAAEAKRRAAADAVEAEKRAEVDREVMREGRQTAVRIGLGLAGLIVAGFLGLAGLMVTFGLPLLERVGSLPGAS